MVRHDAPRDQAVPVTVEVQEGGAYEGGDLGTPQVASAVSDILETLDAIPELLMALPVPEQARVPSDLRLPARHDADWQ